MKRIVAGLWAGLLLMLAAGAPAAAQVDEREPRPAIWLLEDADTKIYLFGTIHLLPPDFRWRSAALDRIIAKARELVVESYEAPGQEEMSEASLLFYAEQPTPILERVPEERREALRAAIEAGPIPVEAYDMMHSWAAAMTLGLSGLMQDYGVAPASDAESGGNGAGVEYPGVETVLEAEFRRAGKPIRSVENAADVLRDLNALPAPVQSRLLIEAIDTVAGVAGMLDSSLTAWVAGKAERMEIGTDEMPPEMHDILLRKRNAAWTIWLADRLRRPGVILFAVGAGHLAGPDSVQRMLVARGLRVRRVG